MSLSVFFSSIVSQDFTPETGFLGSQMGASIQVHELEFPDLEVDKPDLALFGVLDDRMAIGNLGCAEAANIMRRHFYALNQGEYKLRLADLGNIKPGETVTDTYAAVKAVCTELIKSGIMPIIVGGGQDITYAQYLAYEKLEQKVEVAIVDSRFDLDQENTENAPLNSLTYLNHIILHQPDYLFNLSNLAYQTYFVSRESITMYDKLYFNAMRLGLITNAVEHVEPIIRAADMMSFDINAIRFSDAPGNAYATPNGLFGDEACRICRYAGMSDKLTSIGFYEYNPSFDNREQTAILLAQMIWYFIDGFYNRKHDAPLVPKSAYITYRTSVHNDAYELVFVKSKKSDRWWMQVPYSGTKSVNERYHLVPCRYEDYQLAVSGEMPDLWWKTHQKLI
ncbi:formimidoylglutamase [Parapedobacter sp. ISTM3]|uniref:Arginase family enzyme n=1 Tax=Parapedobacter luteus TaxID=623280 RepID=A0A1T5FA06_9SPHI|nr:MULTISPECIES: formimidoylglutamase [Parapedobacter]MBK1442081.1 formimidoylglutamase [Parapedobacter sp. ISTM3]SKB92980.1 Arginase family enzyme [Parapedobacter luteus]